VSLQHNAVKAVVIIVVVVAHTEERAKHVAATWSWCLRKRGGQLNEREQQLQLLRCAGAQSCLFFSLRVPT